MPRVATPGRIGGRLSTGKGLRHSRTCGRIDERMKLSCYLLRESATPSNCLRDTEADVSYFVRRDGVWSAQVSLTDLQDVDAAAALYRTTAQNPTPWQVMIDRWDE